MQSEVHVSRSNRAFLSPTRENGTERFKDWRKARFERETWTYFALLYLHNGRGKNQRSAEINSDRLLYVHIDFEVIWHSCRELPGF